MLDGDDDEPEQFTEYEELGEQYREPDPEPDIEDLQPEIPEAPDYSDADVDRSVSTRFWALVVVFNVGLFVTSLGLMFAVLEGNVDFGLRVTAAGLLVLAYGLYNYRESKQLVEEKLGDGSGEDADGETADTDETEAANDRTDEADDERDSRPLPRGQMRTVEDESGNRYLLLKESGESSLVQDPETGATTHLPDEDFDVVEGESPLTTATTVVPEHVRTVLTAAHDDRALGLLLELDDRGPVDVRTLTGAYDLCESDLHGLLAEFRAAGLVEESEIGGERGYDTTEAASDALEFLRD